MDVAYKAKKLRAMQMQGYKSRVFYGLVFASLLALTCSLFCFCFYWFSSLRSSMKRSLFIYLQYQMFSFFSAKFVFVIFNVIVAFLVGESKLVGSRTYSPAGEIYDEYIEKSGSNTGVSTLEGKAAEGPTGSNFKQENGSDIAKDRKVMEEYKEIVFVPEKACKQLEEDEEEDNGFPAEELNKRVEEFIARVNRQRLLETRLLV